MTTIREDCGCIYHVSGRRIFICATCRAHRIPLDRAALCLDCECVFDVLARQCPACASRTFMALAGIVRASRKQLQRPVAESGSGIDNSCG